MRHSREHTPLLRTVLRHTIGCVVSIVILATGGGIWAYLMHLNVQESAPEDDGDGTTVVTTVAVLPFGKDEKLHVEVDGIVTPFREIEVAAEVGGKIAKKKEILRAGNFVTQGTLLVEIERKDYELELKRIGQQADEVDAELLEVATERENVENLLDNAREELRLNQAELERMVAPSRAYAFSDAEKDQVRKAILLSDNAEKTLNNQLRSLESRRRRLEVAKEIAETAKTKAKYDLDRTVITAPCNGVIVQDFVEEASYAQKGGPLFVIEDTSSVEVRCNLKMEDLYWLWHQEPSPSGTDNSLRTAYEIPSATATVVYRIAGQEDLQYTWQGQLKRYDGLGLDERTRTVPCRVVVDNPREVAVVDRDSENLASERVRPPALVRGMYVTVQLHVQPKMTLVKIPDAAVQPGKWVWRYKDSRLEQIRDLPLIRYLEDGETDGAGDRRAEMSGYWLVPSVESTIEAGDRVVIAPVAGLGDAKRVKENRLEEFDPKNRVAELTLPDA